MSKKKPSEMDIELSNGLDPEEIAEMSKQSEEKNESSKEEK